VITRTKHLLYIVIPAFAVSTLLLVFFLAFSNDGNFLTVEEDRDNDAFLNQETSNTQPKGQNEDDDDYYFLRGAVSSTSEGKQVQENNQINLCGGSFEKRTYFIQEYILPFPCSQPVGYIVYDFLFLNDFTGKYIPLDYDTMQPHYYSKSKHKKVAPLITT
jgi:hypothetical protein